MISQVKDLHYRPSIWAQASMLMRSEYGENEHDTSNWKLYASTVHVFSPRIFFMEKVPRPEFCATDYKTEHASDHVAKFHGDRPRELGDLVAK